ncbi:SHOCT domain-containing protein [Microlunatus elymi]|uniref:SHOCT domain-containing protein n=1 Tax=Microlunatus elymi TaxID=2596828 RepID=A0A516Q0R3_9ACTN|nr:SHOCT domain-containing protein [Microlunatus elymi]QDP96801.1 SHOCT domain-containing protein [Microlunatus elymi]
MLARRFGRPGLVGLAARTAVVAGTASAVSGGMARHQQQRAAEQQEMQAYEQQQQQAQMMAAAQAAQQQAAVQAAPVAPAAQQSVSVDDTVTQLERLAALKEQGILTDAEFAAQKAKILGA